MKIQPIQIWKDGELKTADTLHSYAVHDNFKNSANIHYSLAGKDGVIASGNLLMDGEAYEGYETNEYAWAWVAEKLNLTIIGEEPTPQIP